MRRKSSMRSLAWCTGDWCTGRMQRRVFSCSADRTRFIGGAREERRPRATGVLRKRLQEQMTHLNDIVRMSSKKTDQLDSCEWLSKEQSEIGRGPLMLPADPAIVRGHRS